MKLKKIASLALAGIMAVSMLAGCGEGISNSGSSSSENTDTVTGYSATLQSKLSAHASDKITLSDSNELNNALNYAAGFVGNNMITDEFIDDIQANHGMVTIVGGTGLGGNDALIKARTNLNDAVGAKVKWDGGKTVSENIARLDPDQKTEGDPAYYTKDDVNMVLMYVVDGSVPMENVMEEIADDINDDIIGLTDKYVVTSVGDANFNYTGSVATCTKTYEAGHGVSLTFVAVEIVRHIGK
ncbi:MAG TPA: hypothetical protein H9996_02110 [Candidatus Faecalibacterium avium]|nr:hypothetical protein [Candidatus Faecalibacterium avium]